MKPRKPKKIPMPKLRRDTNIFAAIATEAIISAENVPATFHEFVAGLRTINEAIAERLRLAEEEQAGIDKHLMGEF